MPPVVMMVVRTSELFLYDSASTEKLCQSNTIQNIGKVMFMVLQRYLGKFYEIKMTKEQYGIQEYAADIERLRISILHDHSGKLLHILAHH